jgi:hypothetical protein
LMSCAAARFGKKLRPASRPNIFNLYIVKS